MRLPWRSLRSGEAWPDLNAGVATFPDDIDDTQRLSRVGRADAAHVETLRVRPSPDIRPVQHGRFRFQFALPEIKEERSARQERPDGKKLSRGLVRDMDIVEGSTGDIAGIGGANQGCMAARTARNEHQDGADNGGPEGETPEE